MGKFFRRGKSKVYFLPTVAAYADTNGQGSGNPTSGEITAGTDLTGQIAALSGWDLANSPISIPDLGSVFQKTVPGEDATQASTITFYDDDSVAAVRTALARGTNGYILLCPYGNTTTKRCEVWPVRSSGVNDTWDVGNDAARFVVGFAVTDAPSQNSVLP